jgi:predicted transcriptional regulator
MGGSRHRESEMGNLITPKEMDDLLDRVRTWSPEEQEEAAFILLALEERRKGVYELDEEELAAIEEAEAQAERGEFATDEEMKALYDRYRRP